MLGVSDTNSIVKAAEKLVREGKSVEDILYILENAGDVCHCVTNSPQQRFYKALRNQSTGCKRLLMMWLEFRDELVCFDMTQLLDPYYSAHNINVTVYRLYKEGKITRVSTGVYRKNTDA